MTDNSTSDFAVLVRQVGLDPADHDLEELEAAYVRLRELFVRLETEAPAADAESLAIFDPLKRL